MGKRIFTCVAGKKIMIINIISYNGIKRLKDSFKKSF